MHNAQARLGCAVCYEQYFRAGGALTPNYGFILFRKDYEVRSLLNRVHRGTENEYRHPFKDFGCVRQTFPQMTKTPLAELLGWAAIAAAGLAMLLSALWTLLTQVLRPTRYETSARAPRHGYSAPSRRA